MDIALSLVKSTVESAFRDKLLERRGKDGDESEVVSVVGFDDECGKDAGEGGDDGKFPK